MIQHHFKATKRPNQVYKPSPAVAEVYGQKPAVETAAKTEPELEEEAAIEPAQPTPVVQAHLHEAVRYSRKGEQATTPVEQKLVAFIQEHFLIPEDFDLDYRFGPLSGVSYEQRLISAYEHNLLTRKESSPATLPTLCTNCAEGGHSRRYCPAAL